MKQLAVIREFRTKNFTVVVDAVEEDNLDLSFDETGEVAQKIEDGDYVAFCARVRVFFGGREIASDYLGACIYEDYSAFEDHRKAGKENRKLQESGSKARCGSYMHDMIRAACQQARQTMRDFQVISVRA